MSSENPLETWQTNFKRDMQMLSQLMLLRTQRSDESLREQMRPLFQSVSDSLANLEAAKANLQRYVSSQSAQLSRLHQFHEKLALQKRRVTEIRAVIPTELSDSLGLNGDASIPVSRVGSADSNADCGKENCVGNVEQVSDKPVGTKSVLKKKTVGKAGAQNSRKQKPLKKKKKSVVEEEDDSSIPVIRGVTPDELTAAPQYVRGRLTVDKISGVVTKLNEIARKKYTLLGKPFRELSSSDMTARQDMEEEECKETEGHQFLSDNDIRTFGGYRIDATVKAAINMLRHTGALKEVRGKNRKRMLIIQ